MKIPGYKIFKKIGEGAMASVFLAEQESLGRKVALKVLSPILAGQHGFTERFLKEGRIIAYLNHPRIVSVYDLGSYEHHYYLAMEFLSGGTLEQKIRLGLSAVQSVRFLKHISESLGVAHEHGVIHRDIKPQNIMFRDDQKPVLTDFGIARLMESDPQLTIPGRAVGSPHYMSPEQINGDRIDARTDLYSVGILFYKMLTSRLPYQADQFLTIALMHKTEPIPVLPDEHILFQPILNKLLAKDPDHRYSSAQELIEALTQMEETCLDPRRNSDTDDRLVSPTSKQPRTGLLNGVPEPQALIDINSPTGEEPTINIDENNPESGNNQENSAWAKTKIFGSGKKQPKRRKRLTVLKTAGISIAAVLIIAGGIYWTELFMQLMQPFFNTTPSSPSTQRHPPPQAVDIKKFEVPDSSPEKEKDPDSAKSMNGNPMNKIPAGETATNQAATQEAGTNEAATNEAATNEAATNEAATNEAATNEAATNETATNEAATNEAATNETATNEAATNEAGTNEARTNEAGTNEAGTNEAVPGMEPGNQKQIEQLMATMEKQLKAYHLTAPAGDNCYETYKQVLELDSDGNISRSILIKIGQAYHQLAIKEKKRGRLKIGLEYVEKGLKLLPEETSLMALRIELRNELSKQARILENARKLAQQKRIRAEKLKAIKEQQRKDQEYQARLRKQKELEQSVQVPTTSKSKKQQVPDEEKENPERESKTDIKAETEKQDAKEKKTERKNRLFGTF